MIKTLGHEQCASINWSILGSANTNLPLQQNQHTNYNRSKNKSSIMASTSFTKTLNTFVFFLHISLVKDYHTIGWPALESITNAECGHLVVEKCTMAI